MLLYLGLFGAQGEQIYNRLGCYGCHGPFGEGTSDYPKLANKPAAYLIKRLTALKNGRGVTTKAELMIPFAKPLDEDEIKALAEYLADIRPDESIKRYEPDHAVWGDGGS